MTLAADSSSPHHHHASDADAAIVRAAIHPAIGIARMGNSHHGFYVGPEVTEPLPQPPGFMHDAAGALKRQAARFRVYGYDAAGNVVRELTSHDADIRWTVHVANHKASWYQWSIALDIPEAAGTTLPLRNAAVSDRAGLAIDPGPRSITGAWEGGPAYELNGAFQGTPVNLGEVRTDEAGRLLFLGGRGVSASPTGSPIYDRSQPNAFINANGWYDDASDGPVTAEVSIGGRPIPVDPAWVVTAPPNYAPEAIGVRTLYDLLVDCYVDAGWMKRPSPVSFRQDVYPILQRLSNLQWVNAGFAAQFGRGGPHDFDDPACVRTLSWLPSGGDADRDVYREVRLQLFNSFRAPEPTDNSPLPWPWIYGDDMNNPPSASPRQNASVSPVQYGVLQAWAAGQFVDDWERPYDPPRFIGQVPLRDQPAMLDRAALHFCLADAFHPGCEVTWPMRHVTLFSSPFRIIHRSPDQPEPDYGPVLTPEIALSATGPLHAQGPGDLTRWMGLPWQADTGFCRSGYGTKTYSYDPFIPTFWPARVPNQVLTKEAYEVVRDTCRPRQERLDAFTNRASWTRWLDGPDTGAQMEQMVELFGSFGVVELREGVAGDPVFPPVMGVEALGGALAHPQPAAKAAPSGLFAVAADVAEVVTGVAGAVTDAVADAAAVAAEPASSPDEALRLSILRRAGWRSFEEAEDAPTPVQRPGKG